VSTPAGAACMLAAAILLGGCAGKPPAIARVNATITCTLEVPSGRAAESLGVFLVASDPDGLEDLAAFYVIHDEAELYWKVEKSQWTSATAEGEAWIGTNTLALPPGLPAPGGDYRVVLQDAAGETVEQTFTLPGPGERPTAATVAWPRVEVKDGTITVSGPWKNPEVRVYGSDGRFRAAFAAGGKAGGVEVKRVAAALPDLGEEFTFRVWAVDEPSSVGVLVGPYSSRALPPQ
jgi:hypothetical protein